MLATKTFTRIVALGNKNQNISTIRRFASNVALKKTTLHPLHLELKGKMVEFCDWDMPVQYESEGIVASHLHTRAKAGLFDVSHMAQLRLTGKDRVKFLEGLVVGDIAGLPENHATLSLFTNEKGGIIDDTIITNRGDHIYLVVNAGCADKDIAHITKHLKEFQNKGGDVKMERIDRSLIAIQGPAAEAVVAKLGGQEVTRMPFMTCKEMNLGSVPNCLVSRCGYTGEDGFEISVAHEHAIALARALLSNPDVHPAGLGARDSLRLEAGLCLYGHDINEDISPIEASLLWTIGKRRRAEGGFLGADIILPQIKGGVSKKRVGLTIQGAPAREGVNITAPGSDQSIGQVTSGTHSPVLKQSIAMAYVSTPFSKNGSNVTVHVRGREYPATVTKMPFVPTNYKRLD